MLALTATSLVALAAENNPWDGEWIAEGTLFQIGVTVENNTMKVVQIESMGQLWSNQDGSIEGNIARVEVAVRASSPSMCFILLPKGRHARMHDRIQRLFIAQRRV